VAHVHGDLGTWNIVTRDSDFTVVDWESARRPGLALSDLAYFLADALTLMPGRGVAVEDQTTAMLRLFRGETDLSDVLFAWIRRATTAIGVAAADVGPVLTLTWLGHARSPQRRRQALQDSPPATAAPHARLAARWLTDPKLGWRWDAWRT
jgi:Ser/Thr protein kinase RdoA (MazF antagonist)